MFNRLKNGDVIKITTDFKCLEDVFPKDLVTEIMFVKSYSAALMIKDLCGKECLIHRSHFIKASKREAFHYHIYGPHISEGE